VSRRDLRVALMWLVPTIGAALISLVVSPGGLVWALAVSAVVLSGVNLALHLDLVSEPAGQAS
jgi:hypothetical protein